MLSPKSSFYTGEKKSEKHEYFVICITSRDNSLYTLHDSNRAQPFWCKVLSISHTRRLSPNLSCHDLPRVSSCQCFLEHDSHCLHRLFLQSRSGAAEVLAI